MHAQMKICRESGVEYLIALPFTATGLVRHAFSTRRGGVSHGELSAMNIGWFVGEEAERVRENRRRLCSVIGTDLSQVVAPRQEHTANVAVVSSADCGKGAANATSSIPATDALLTNNPGVMLMACFADCVPVLFLDPGQRAVGVAHAGWRGTVAGVARKTLDRMMEEYGTKPEDCLVVIGPSIGPCCYVVDEKVINPLREVEPEWPEMVKECGIGQWRLDLWEANRRQLLRGGVRPEHLTVSGICTQDTQDLFYSHRGQEGKAGRFAALIGLK